MGSSNSVETKDNKKQNENVNDSCRDTNANEGEILLISYKPSTTIDFFRLNFPPSHKLSLTISLLCNELANNFSHHMPHMKRYDFNLKAFLVEQNFSYKLFRMKANKTRFSSLEFIWGERKIRHQDDIRFIQMMSSDLRI
ncbi:CLUMA_CG018292, isoform A [Clunio marinus]|uniref:CLUMA_CG018292, isoform A n=1 Tax=Clunio marinus TaxID=568069 RepID=A0A1J1IYU9_9DIPT|nr:CLUMA_CG018292, isoform A [Clunio marinus]